MDDAVFNLTAALLSARELLREMTMEEVQVVAIYFYVACVTQPRRVEVWLFLLVVDNF